MELHNYKKEMMQIVRLLCATTLILFQSCAEPNQEIHSHNNKGGYITKFTGSANVSVDSVFVHGSIYDFAQQTPLQKSTVSYMCRRAAADHSGYYGFWVAYEPQVDYFFQATSLGYKSVVTEPILPESDTLYLIFYLDRDIDPIFHCND